MKNDDDDLGSSAEAGDFTGQERLNEAGALPPAALRARAEAEERRQSRHAPATKTEVGGRVGPDPVRYGDWENGGIVSDF